MKSVNRKSLPSVTQPQVTCLHPSECCVVMSRFLLHLVLPVRSNIYPKKHRSLPHPGPITYEARRWPQMFSTSDFLQSDSLSCSGGPRNYFLLDLVFIQLMGDGDGLDRAPGSPA